MLLEITLKEAKVALEGEKLVTAKDISDLETKIYTIMASEKMVLK